MIRVMFRGISSNGGNTSTGLAGLDTVCWSANTVTALSDV